MKEEDIVDILKLLEKNANISIKIDNNIDQINRKFAEIPSEIVETFKRYTDPQKNIEELISFYRTIIRCIENIRKLEPGIVDSDETGIDQYITSIDCYNRIEIELDGLKSYSDVSIVKKLQVQTRKTLEKALEPVFDVFFKHFMRKDVNDLRILSRFLIVNDETRFIQKYCKVLLHQHCVGQSKKECKVVLEKLRDIKTTFDKIGETNEIFLDDKNAEVVYNQLHQMILIDLKEAVSKILLDLENKFKIMNVVEACQFYIHLQEPVVRDYFKEFNIEILKVINNLFITLVNEINRIKKPNKKVLHESFVYALYKLLEVFKDKKLHLIFIELHDTFEFRNYPHMKIRFGQIACERVIELSAEFKGIQKNVYLLNNFCLIQFYCQEYLDIKITDYIIKFSDEIVKMWNKECEKKRGTDLTRFLDVNLEVQKQYYLPDELREGIIPRIRMIIDDVLKESTYKNNKGTIKQRVTSLFSYGDEEQEKKNEVTTDSLEERQKAIDKKKMEEGSNADDEASVVSQPETEEEPPMDDIKTKETVKNDETQAA